MSGINISNTIFEEHRKTWTQEEKSLLHDKLNQHRLGDGVNIFEVQLMELMSMIFIDGVRAGRG